MGVRKKVRTELILAEFEQAIITFRAGFTTLSRIGALLIIADVTVIGYAINTRIAGIVFLGAIFPFGIMYLIKVVGKLLTPVIITAYSIEKEYGDNKIRTLMNAGLSINLSKKFSDKLESILSVKDAYEQDKMMSKVYFPMLGPGRLAFNSLLILFAIAQLVAPFFLRGHLKSMIVVQTGGQMSI